MDELFLYRVEQRCLTRVPKGDKTAWLWIFKIIHGASIIRIMEVDNSIHRAPLLRLSSKNDIDVI